MKLVFFTIIGVCLLQIINAQPGNVAKAPGTNFSHRPGTKLKQEDESLRVDTIGNGRISIILLTEHSQGKSFYESFAKRNSSFATFYIITPPGIAGTAAYNWPDSSEEFISRPWLSKLEIEITDYIQKNFTGDKPYMLATWFAGYNVVLNIADKNPDLFKGLILVGNSISLSPYYRLYNSARSDTSKVIDIAAQRKAVSRYINLWRTVDEFTWHSNTFQSSFYSKNDSLAKIVKLNEAKTPIPIAIRYFTEYAMNDYSELISRCKVPLLALAQFPSFAALQKRINGLNMDNYDMLMLKCKRDWFYGINKNVQLHFFEDAGLMIWEDEPHKFDILLNQFIKQTK